VSRLNPNTPEQQVLVNNIKANQARLRAVFADVVSTLEGAAQTHDAAVDMAFIQVSWSRMEVQNQGMVFDAQLLSQKFHAEIDQSKQTNEMLIFALVGLFGAYFVANYVLIYRHTLKSISELQAGTKIIGSGHLDFAIPEKAADEIGELARAFNRMTANLKEVTASKADLEREIAEREQAEQALRASEERFRSLFESINEGFALHEIICDPLGEPIDYRFLEINPAFERLTSLKRENIIGKTVRTVLPAIEDYWIQAYGQVALTGEPAHFENYSSALGQYYEVFAHRPAPGQFAVLFLNITERKLAEERIQKLNRELEQQAEELQQMNLQLEETLAEEQVAREEAEAGRNVLESLMHYAPEVIFIADAPDARIRMVSQYAEVMSGRPLAQLLGVPADAHPVRRDLLQSDGVTPMAFESLPVVRAVKRGETVLDYEMILWRPDGVKRTILANAGPIRDARGNITGGIAVWRDITARKQIEQQVQKLNHDLEQRAVELQIANKELESFSYSISHDLRMPLASINGFANILLKDCAQQLSPDALRYLELIRNNSMEMNQLVEGLLAFSRFIRQPLRKQTVDLNQLVRQALEDLRAQQQGRRVEMEIGDLATCEADPVLLKQVLVNLLSNALKFTRQREVARIEIKATQRDESEILYSVRDNGVGFDPQEAEKLFGVFQRLHSQEEYEGTGVGLAIVERIICRHGGRVCAEGEVDRGATFYFTLG
jgi:PAS domain S-box-containing protein